MLQIRFRYSSRSFLHFLLCFVGLVPLAHSQTCDWDQKIKALTSDIQSNRNPEKALSLYSRLGLAYYENERYDLAQNAFLDGMQYINDTSIPDTANWFFLLDQINANDDVRLLDSLSLIVNSQVSKNHPVKLILEVEKNYGMIMRKDPNYDDAHLLQVTSQLKKGRHKYYGVLGDDYRSSFYHQKNNITKAIEIIHDNIDFIKHHFRRCNKQLIRSYVRLGRRYLDNRQLDSALHYLSLGEQSILKYFPLSVQQLVETRLLIAQTFIDQNRPDSSIYYLEKLERTCVLDSSVFSSLPSVYNLWGRLYRTQLQFDKAILYSKKQIHALERVHSQESPQLFAAYHNIGARFMDYGEYHTAGIYLRRALDICIDQHGEQHPYTAITLLTLGTYYERIDEYSQAKDFTERSWELRKEIYGAENPRTINALLNLAVLHRNHNEFEQAQAYVNLAYKTAVKLNDMGQQIRCHILISQIYNYQDNFVEALLWIEKAKSYYDKDLQLGRVEDPIQYLKICQEEIINKYGAITNNMVVTSNGLESLNQGLEIFLWQFNTIQSNADKLKFLNEYGRLLEYSSAMLLHKHTQNSDHSYLQRAMSIADFLNQTRWELQRQENNLFNADDDVLNTLSELYATIAQNKIAQIRLVNTGKIDEAQVYNQIITHAQNRYDSIVSIFDTIFHRFSITPWDSTYNTLEADQVYLQLVVLEESIVAYKIEEGEVEGHEFPLDEKIYEQIVDLRKQEITPQIDYPGSEELHHLFQDILVWANPNDLPLIVITDLELEGLALEAIRIDHLYAIQKYPIHYVQSFRSTDGKPTYSKRLAFYGFAPEYEEMLVNDFASDKVLAMVRSGVFALPYGRLEIDWIQQIVGGRTFVKGSANRSNFLAALNKPGIIHLSMHALIDQTNPWESKLLFNSEDGSIDALYLHEINQKNAQAKMVVLSACQSGRGLHHMSEGVRSFSNVFQQIGIPTVAMSKWKVPDEHTARIMKSFYQNLNNGDDPSIALQGAKIDFIENGMSAKLLHPYYWAGMVLIGDSRPVRFAAEYDVWIIIVSGMVIAMISVLVFWHRRKARKSQTINSAV